jgi:peptidoglycan LD-endopeptidase LytH
MLKSARWRLFIGLIVTFGLVVAITWFVAKRRATYQALPPVASVSPSPTPAETRLSIPSPSPSISATPDIASPTPTELPSEFPTASPAISPTIGPLTSSTFVGTLKLIIPVAGVKESQLLDTFDDARSEGRVHDAIDIPAAQGTPVLAAADGKIIKLFLSDKGGTTIYQLSTNEKLVFYYAHLQGYAPGIAEGKLVRQGELIAYVGDTGNAGAGNYHLHFSIAVLADPKRYWEGTNINPYPLLRGR